MAIAATTVAAIAMVSCSTERPSPETARSRSESPDPDFRDTRPIEERTNNSTNRPARRVAVFESHTSELTAGFEIDADSHYWQVLAENQSESNLRVTLERLNAESLAVVVDRRGMFTHDQLFRETGSFRFNVSASGPWKLTVTEFFD